MCAKKERHDKLRHSLGMRNRLVIVKFLVLGTKARNYHSTAGSNGGIDEANG